MTEQNYRPFPKRPPEVARLEEEVLPGSRTELFEATIVAVDAAKGEAEELGYTKYAGYLDREIFPFLYAERDLAAKEEGLAPFLRWQHSILPRW